MAKFFAVSTDPLEAEHEKAFKAKLSPAGWWHWLPNFWLVHDIEDKLSAPAIRDMLSAINSTARALVIEVQPGTWAALTKKDAEGNDMSEWLHKHMRSGKP